MELLSGQLTRSTAVLCVLAAVFFGSIHGEMSVSVDISENHARAGENITVICRVTGGDPSSLLTYKEIRTDDGNTVQEPIASNDILVPLYNNLGRFSIRKEPTGSAHLFILTISKVTDLDSGHYGCYIMEQPDAYASEKLEVYKQPQSIYFNNNTDGEPIQFVQGQPQLLECHVLGVVPNPEVRVWVGDRDYTDQFSKDASLEVLCGGSIGQKPENCPIYFVYNVIMRHPTFELQDYTHGEKLRCQATVPDSGYDNILVSNLIDYQHSPKFTCDRDFYAVIGTKDYKLSCIVETNPEPFEWVWTFTVDGKYYELSLSGDAGYSHDVVHAMHKTLNDTASEYTLTIKEVTDSYFIEYKLALYQDIGNITNTFRLNEGEPTTTQAGSSIVMSSIVVLVSSFLLHLMTKL